jgi:hypothetical protein
MAIEVSWSEGDDASLVFDQHTRLFGRHYSRPTLQSSTMERPVLAGFGFGPLARGRAGCLALDLSSIRCSDKICSC